MKTLKKITINILLPGALVMAISCEQLQPENDLFTHQLTLQTSGIEIEWELLSNFEPDTNFSARLTLNNKGENVLPSNGWSLFLNSIRPLVPESFLPEIKAEHINGDFFKLTPTEEFRIIEPGESREINYLGRFFSIKASDAPQGFYFVFDDGHIETVENIIIHPFTREEQTNRTEDDLVEVPEPQSIFGQNENLSLLRIDDVSKVTPTPVSVEKGTGSFLLRGTHTIYHHEYLGHEAEMLADYLSAYEGVQISIRFLTDEWNGSGILLDLEMPGAGNSEAYKLEVNPELIKISANDRQGVFYGIQSLRALAANSQNDELQIESVTIEDEPAFGYRGMHLDVSRNFQSMESVKQLLDVMAMYKMNKFHFHLTDDEGWRLAIDALPELVEIGGRRGHTETEEFYLIPAYGSGPDPTPGNSFGSGWYSRDEYIEILKFAADRHIEVIPEIDVPGHARAAIIAMRARAERLSKEGDYEGANAYRLDEEGDESEYRSIQFFNDNVINVCLESAYNFLELVFDDLISMHALAGAPLNTIHIGGDEVPAGVWQGSPACAEYMEEHGIENTRELQVLFFDNLRKMLEARDIRMAGWEEIAFMGEPHGEEKTPNPDFVGSVFPHIWSNVWGTGTEDFAYNLANMGYEIVMSHASNFYFDFAYNKHWEEPGFYWAAMFNTKEPYSFIPSNLYKNAITDSYGNPIAPDHFKDAELLTEEGRQNILGLQGQLWTETVNRQGRMAYMILPRLIGLAERAWVGDAEWSLVEDTDQMWSACDEAWNEFANRIGRFELNRLDQYFGDINYRIPAPGVVVRDGILMVNSDFPGLMIRYETDGEEPEMNSPVYEGPADISGSEYVKVAVFNSTGRRGRSVTVYTESEN